MLNSRDVANWIADQAVLETHGALSIHNGKKLNVTYLHAWPAHSFHDQVNLMATAHVVVWPILMIYVELNDPTPLTLLIRVNTI